MKDILIILRKTSQIGIINKALLPNPEQNYIFFSLLRSISANHLLSSGNAISISSALFSVVLTDAGLL